MLGNAQPLTERPPAEDDAATVAAAVAAAQPRQRLIVTKMVLKDFKSYAGTQVVGPFHKSFSAIVGPNGSGKSNVIDSLLFVFGFRASKIRQGKLSELIHSSKGSDSPPSCSVEVHFKEIIDRSDSDGYEDVPGSTLVISRAAYRNNTSKYFINGATSSHADVTALLRSKGVDLDHKRFLILQGEVESISQMKPKAQNEHEEGLLEYLEDIIGTSKYKEQIESASEEVDRLSDGRAAQLNLTKIAERDLASMEDKKDEAVKFIEGENELVKKKATLYQYRIYESTIKTKAAQEQYDEIKTALEGEMSKFNKFREDIQTLEQSYNMTLKEFEALEKKAKEAAKELSKFEREDVQIQENRKHLKNKLKKLLKSIEKDQFEISTLKTNMENNAQDLKSGNEEIGQLEKRLKMEQKTLEEIIEGLKGRTDEFSAEVEKRQQELAPWNEKIAARQSQLDVVRTEIGIIKAKMEEAGNQVEAAREELARLRQVRAEKDQELNSKIEQLERLNDEVSSAEAAISELRVQEKEAKEAYIEARDREAEARESIKATESEGAVLRELLLQRDKGHIVGIYGRLGALGTIDDKYDVAISTACPSLSNIVVDTVETGQRCIEFLRKNNIGRAKFIILDQLPKGKAFERPSWAPKNVTRLFDLINPSDERFLPAFFHATGNTLVADNLTEARKIAYGGRRVMRVVTLDGNLISASGSMTGGGNRQIKGAMSSRPINQGMTPTKLATLEAKRENMEAAWREASTRLTHYEERLKQLNKQKSELEGLLPRLEMDLKLVHEQIQGHKKRIKHLHAESQSPKEEDQKRFEELARAEADHEAAIAELKNQCTQIEGAIKELQEKIMQVGGVQLRVQKTKVDDLRIRINTLNEQISSWERSRIKSEQDMARLERSLAKREAEKEELTQQLNEIAKSIEANTASAVEVKEHSDKVQAKADDKRDEMDRIKAELDELNESYAEMRTRELDMKHQMNSAEKQLAEARKSSNYWRSELDRLELQPLTDLDRNGDTDTDGMEIESQGDDQDAEANKGPAKNSDSSDPKLPTFTEEELRELNISALVKQIGQLEARVQGAKPNLSILSEYRERSRDYRAKKRACDEITARRDEAQVHYDNLRKRRLDEFMTGFNTISYKLKEMYQMITMGGNAELELVDSLDPFSEGIVFSVMPPKKSWKNIANLSGGEKTLSSLALVFALHQFKPTPIYVMDEIDAALDFRNVSIVANYIREQTRDAQFVIISLRNNMFELADRLIGIYKTDSRTKSIAINPNASAHLLAAAAASNKDGTLSATRAAASVGGAASTAS